MFYYNLGIVVEVKLCADTLSWCPCTILHLNNTIQLSVCLWPATQKIWMNILSLGAQCYICEIYIYIYICAKMFRCMQIRFNYMPNLHM